MAQISALNCTISADTAAQSIDNAQIPDDLKGIRQPGNARDARYRAAGCFEGPEGFLPLKEAAP